MRTNIIGRGKEQTLLEDCLASNKAEFVAIYGRRRVGKTFLVKEFFENNLFFYATGILEGTTDEQIANFNEELIHAGAGHMPKAPDWHTAFANLNQLIRDSQRKEKKVIFLDEVPWMDTPDSGFLAALDHFWNRWMTSRRDVVLIVCGSATSWILDNLVKNYGGLHNRLTRQIFLQPFTLGETEQLFEQGAIRLTRYQMVEAYMVFGGIPYYLSLFVPRLSLYQNIDALYFAQGAPLATEYQSLYRSLFRKAEGHLRIIEALATKGISLTREQIIELSGLSDGGSLTTQLADLENNGFIRVYRSFGKKKRGRLYQLIDPFTLFHLRFDEMRRVYNNDYWLQFAATGAYRAWSGYAFELVCLLHTNQIKRSLGIAGVLTEISAWRSREHDPGAQIDLVIDRNDHVINLCEIKFASGEFTIDKAYGEALRNKRAAFLAETKTRKGVVTTLVTTFGLKRNSYQGEISSEVTLEALFA